MKSLILGIGGQDGSYLADLLVAKGHEVHGMYRKSSYGNLKRIDHLMAKVHLWSGDMGDPTSIQRIIHEVNPDVIYNEADQDSVGWSMNNVGYTMDITAGAVGRLFEIVRGFNPKIKIFQPCTAMMFGDPAILNGSTTSPQNENTPFNPQSPYACAKVAAYYLSRHYRREYGMFISTGILYNHDSERRADYYLLHKLCKGVIAVAKGKQQTVALGNLDAAVDIGYAREYMEAVVKIMDLPEPDDYVIGTGTAHTIGEIAEYTFHKMGLGVNGRIIVDPEFFRPTPKSVLRADCTKLTKATGWQAYTKAKTLVVKLLAYYQN